MIERSDVEFERTILQEKKKDYRIEE